MLPIPRWYVTHVNLSTGTTDDAATQAWQAQSGPASWQIPTQESFDDRSDDPNLYSDTPAGRVGWLIAPRPDNSRSGKVIIRCPEHRTRYIERLAERGTDEAAQE
jgi:hypothetical protein